MCGMKRDDIIKNLNDFLKEIDEGVLILETNDLEQNDRLSQLLSRGFHHFQPDFARYDNRLRKQALCRKLAIGWKVPDNNYFSCIALFLNICTQFWRGLPYKLG